MLCVDLYEPHNHLNSQKMQPQFTQRLDLFSSSHFLSNLKKATQVQVNININFMKKQFQIKNKKNLQNF